MGGLITLPSSKFYTKTKGTKDQNDLHKTKAVTRKKKRGKENYGENWFPRKLRAQLPPSQGKGDAVHLTAHSRLVGALQVRRTMCCS